jgi:hypothetical protein
MKMRAIGFLKGVGSRARVGDIERHDEDILLHGVRLRRSTVSDRQEGLDRAPLVHRPIALGSPVHVVGDSDESDVPTRPRAADGLHHRLLCTDGLDHRMRADTFR